MQEAKVGGQFVQAGPPPDLEAIKQTAMSTLLPALAGYREQLQAERDHQAEIKEKYAKSLEYLILRLDGDLIALYDRRERGDKVDLPIHNKEEQKRGYEKALVELQRTSGSRPAALAPGSTSTWSSTPPRSPNFIQDPANSLQPQERVEVRYLVGVGDITGKGERV